MSQLSRTDASAMARRMITMEPVAGGWEIDIKGSPSIFVGNHFEAVKKRTSLMIACTCKLMGLPDEVALESIKRHYKGGYKKSWANAIPAKVKPARKEAAAA